MKQETKALENLLEKRESMMASFRETSRVFEEPLDEFSEREALVLQLLDRRILWQRQKLVNMEGEIKAIMNRLVLDSEAWVEAKDREITQKRKRKDARKFLIDMRAYKDII